MSALESEFNWRMAQWERIQQSPTWPIVTAQEIRDLNLYSGAAGIYRDKSRTQSLAADGITVSIMNSAGNYGDEIDGEHMIYDYPKTSRSLSHDTGEIASLKNAMNVELPVFVISELPGNGRSIRLGWIIWCEDSAGACLLRLDEKPQSDFEPLADLETEFKPKVNRKLSPTQITKVERDPKFKFNLLVRYKTTCALTDITVEKMLDGAHIIPVAEQGSDDPRNGLLLSSSVHRAFDSHYWAIHPETLVLATRENGPTLNQMKITRSSLKHLNELPHQEALEHRWRSFEKASNRRILLAS